MVNYGKVNKNDLRRRPRSSSGQDKLLQKVDSLQMLEKAMMLKSPTPSGGTVIDKKRLQDSFNLASSRMNKKYTNSDALGMISQGLKILDLDSLDTELLSESSSTSRTEATTKASSDSSSKGSSRRSSSSSSSEKEKTNIKKQRKVTDSTDMSTAAKKTSSSSSSSKDRKKSKRQSSKSSKRSSDDPSRNERKKKKDKSGFHARFRLSMNEYIPPSSAPLTEEEISDAWYTKEQFERMSSKCDTYVDEFGKKHSDSIQDMIRLVALCYQPTNRQQQQHQQKHFEEQQTSRVDGVDPKNKNKNNKNKKLIEEQSDVEAELMYTCCLSAATSVSIPSRARGLEYDIIRPLSESRRRHVRTIVEMFGDSRPSTRDLLMSTSGEDLDEVVAARSILLSRPHRMFARALAELDSVALEDA